MCVEAEGTEDEGFVCMEACAVEGVGAFGDVIACWIWSCVGCGRK